MTAGRSVKKLSLVHRGRVIAQSLCATLFLTKAVIRRDGFKRNTSRVKNAVWMTGPACVAHVARQRCLFEHGGLGSLVPCADPKYLVGGRPAMHRECIDVGKIHKTRRKAGVELFSASVGGRWWQARPCLGIHRVWFLAPTDIRKSPPLIQRGFLASWNDEGRCPPTSA